ncbi:hypothetical protein V8D89_008826 [Ganoderma adspersum]
MSWAIPLLSKRTLLRSLGLRGCRVNSIKTYDTRWNPEVHANILLERPFATSGSATRDPGPPTLEDMPETPHVQARTRLEAAQRPIRTLDPSKVTPDDYMDISFHTQPSLRVVLNSTLTQRFTLYATTSDWSSGVFPSTTQGFLYYHIPPRSPPLAGELRFRLTPSGSRDPAGFAAGSDLLVDVGLPWRYPLWKIVCREECRGVARLLVQDGLTSQDTLDAAVRAAALLRRSGRAGTDHGSRKMSSTPVLSTLGQEFVYRFGVMGSGHYLFAGADSIVRQSFKYAPSLRLQGPHTGKVFYYPYEGSAVCCFEQSMLPAHKGKRVIVMRVLRFLANNPVRYVPAPDGRDYEALRPREGELVKTLFRGQLQPWALEVDNLYQTRSKRRKALRILFENEEMYGAPKESTEREVQDVRQGESQESRSRPRSPADESRHLQAIPHEPLSPDFRRSNYGRLPPLALHCNPNFLSLNLTVSTISPPTGPSAAVNPPEVQIPQAFPNSLGAVLAAMLPVSRLLQLTKMAPPLTRWQMHSNVSEPFRRCRLSTTSTRNPNLDINTGKDTPTTVRKIKRPRRKIRTLDPSKLVGDDYIDFSMKSEPSLGILLKPDLSSNPLYHRPYRNANFSGAPWSSNRFPPGTHGFIYYHVPPYSSPLAGELRFRVTSSRNPASFTAGTDLLTERGMPWRYPLYKIVCRPNWTDFVALLLQDGLVSQPTLDLVTAAVAPLHTGSSRTNCNAWHTRVGGLGPSDVARHPNRLSSTPVLSAFGQEFLLHYTAGRNFCGVFASTGRREVRDPARGRFSQSDTKRSDVCHVPLSGSIVFCFERSMLPEHAGRRVVVIRIKRFIGSDPIRLALSPSESPSVRAHLFERVRPHEGELVKTVVRNRVQPWAADVDKVWSASATHVGSSPWKALRVLFENEELYGSPYTS